MPHCHSHVLRALVQASAVCVPLCFGGRLLAQEPERPAWESIYQLPSRPNYLTEIMPEDPASIRLPPPPPHGPPAAVRGIYLNAWGFGSSRFYRHVALADTTEINAFVIDVKDGTGYITFPTSIPLAVEIGANRDVRASDVRERLALLRERGIYPIARIVVAKDPLLATHKPTWAVRDVDGGQWKDRFGDAWVDAFRDSVWMYAADVAAEAILMGFREVQFDYIRFPDEPPELLERAVYPARLPRESKRGGIRRNLRVLKERINQLGVPFTLDVFGLTTSANGDLGIGQNWEDVLSIADVVLPMVYPSHYYAGAFGLPWPNAEPYTVIRRALEDGIRRAEEVPGAAKIRPFLQSFSIRRVRYTALEVRAQIDAAEDLGLTDWVLWNASGRYPAGAFRPREAAAASPGTSH